MSQTGSVLILNYHRLSSESNLAKKNTGDPYAITPAEFRKQLNLLRQLNIPVIPAASVTAGSFNLPFGICITLDDGYQSDFEFACPILEEFNFTASLFPITEFVGKEKRLNWNQLKELSSRGFAIGSHGLTHSMLTEISITQQQTELLHSKLLIEKNTGADVQEFAFPYGQYNRQLLGLAKKAGYQTVFSTHFRMNQPAEKPFLLHRCNIRNNTSFEQFRKIVEGRGHISAGIKIANETKALARKFLGAAISERISRIKR